MPYFRKKPVQIEAIKLEAVPWQHRMTVPNWQTVEAWCDNKKVHPLGNNVDDKFQCIGFNIETLEGTMTAVAGDWIIRGVKGELYPCKPEIFDATYDPA